MDNNNMVSAKSSFRKHFMTYLVAIVVFAIVNFFVYTEMLWVLWFVVIWGCVVFIHFITLRSKTTRYKNSDTEFLKSKAAELKTGKPPEFREWAKPKLKSEVVKTNKPDAHRALWEDEPLDLENIEMVEAVAVNLKPARKKTKKKSTKKKPGSKKKTVKKRTTRKTTKKKTAKRRKPSPKKKKKK